MKKIIVVIGILIAGNAIAQDKAITSDTFQISGKVKKQVTYTLAALDTFKKTSIGDMEFLNRKEMKYAAKNVKGIPLKNLFTNIEFDAENHKALNRFYFVFSAADGFKVVFSYNEIVSAQSAGNFYLVTDYNGKSMKDTDERILIISANNVRTGHKYIKALNEIVVKEAE